MAHFVHLALRQGINLDLVVHWVDHDGEVFIYAASDDPVWRLTGPDRLAWLAYMRHHGYALQPPRAQADDDGPPF